MCTAWRVENAITYFSIGKQFLPRIPARFRRAHLRYDAECANIKENDPRREGAHTPERARAEAKFAAIQVEGCLVYHLIIISHQSPAAAK